MKIGITTFQRAHNFGAQMQMYALYTILKQEGHDVWILDYHCPPVEDPYTETNLFRNPRRFISKRLYPGIELFIKCLKSSLLGYQKTKCERFSTFLTENFQLTRRFDEAEDMPTAFDVLITGSDQLWNYYITKGRREVYFLDNKNNSHKMPRRLSYAVSVESSHYEELIQDKEYVISVLKNFDWVTVREKTLADMLKKEMGILAENVLDPSLFLTRHDCLKIAKKPKEEHYLCVYQVEHTSYLSRLARIIAKERKLKIVNVKAALCAYTKEESYGPREILGYICYADVVLTSSFHGTAFSIINRKNFYSAYDSPSARVQNLLDFLGLQDRFLMNLEDFRDFEDAIFDEQLINDYVSISQNALLKALNK